MQFTLLPPHQLPGRRETHGELTVVRPGRAGSRCPIDVVLPGGSYVEVLGDAQDSQPALDPCRLAEASTTTVLRVLAAGPVPEVAEDPEPTSLFWRHACPLLGDADLRTVPGLDPRAVFPGFGDWSCNWGHDPVELDFRAPAVEVYFERIRPLAEGEDGRREQLAGRDTFVKLGASDRDQTDCRASSVFANGGFPNGSPKQEVLSVEVYADLVPDEQCRLARQLLGRASTRLAAQAPSPGSAR